MAMQLFLCLGFLFLFNSVAQIKGFVPSHNSSSPNRGSFPAGFLFGTGSSAYQYEGAVKEGGRGSSIWDTFTHKYPGKIKDGSNGDVAVDFYHKYKEDIRIMKEIGMDAFRFSISWPRLLPSGNLSGGVNKAGIAYYNGLINELLSNGLQPFVTLFHWDLPQGLEDEYGGFLSPHIVDDFRDYAELCFREFGDRVKHWVTLNQPSIFSTSGYALGTKAPNRCSRWVSKSCVGGDSATEPYVVSHNQILAHAAAVQVYRHKYQASQKGKIGITLVSEWMVPFSPAKFDKEAAGRALDFAYGWIMDPLTYGDYPRSMRSLVGRRLPKFTKVQSSIIKGSYDFLGLNYYTSDYAANLHSSNAVHASSVTDSHANLTAERNGVPIGPVAALSWLHVYPRGIHDLLLHTKSRYNNPIIYITENGICEANNGKLSLKEALRDGMRIDYYRRHISFVQQAIKEGVDVRGYFAWSLLDNFEWAQGFTVRFGLVYVDFKDGLKRYPKHSALWFKKFLQK